MQAHTPAPQTSGDLDEEAIQFRMNQSGFPELEQCWRDFCTQGVSLTEIDEESVDHRRASHMSPLFGAPVLSGLAVAGSAIGISASVGAATDEMTRPLPPPLRPVADAGFMVNVALLLTAGTIAVQRYLLHPFKKLMGLETAAMLRWGDYRSHFEQGDRAREAQLELASLGITEIWDKSSYSRDYRLAQGQVQQVERPTAEELIMSTLRDLLGQKDETTRKHVPGRFTPALLNGKRSVTDIVNRYGEQIALAKSGQLPREQAAEWFGELRSEFLKPESEAARVLGVRAEGLRQADFPIPEQAVRARIWARDPWVDLTSQKEFFSSASLRGNSIFESGSKGRLGNFAYLHNPSICCLDFSTRKGRAVRARLLAATVDGPEGKKPVLFVDGVEGTNSVATLVIKTAIEDYAKECGFHAVLYNTAVHNSTPKAFVRSMARLLDKPKEFAISAIDSSTREYLDAFGFPIQPMEYQFPKGLVRALMSALQTGAEKLGQEESTLGKTKRFLQRNLLYVFYGDAILFSTVACLQTSGYLAAGMLAVGAAGLAANHWYQGRSVRALDSGRAKTASAA